MTIEHKNNKLFVNGKEVSTLIFTDGTTQKLPLIEDVTINGSKNVIRNSIIVGNNLHIGDK